MATISKNNESVKSVVANKAWAVLVWLGNVCENTAKGLVMIIALLAITFIFFNPLIFIPYCLLAPKRLQTVCMTGIFPFIWTLCRLFTGRLSPFCRSVGKDISWPYAAWNFIPTSCSAVISNQWYLPAKKNG